MWNILNLLARIVGAAVGGFCVLTAVLLYANEEGEIQTALEKFWVQLDDYKILALSRHTAFMQQVAVFESRLLDWLFGKRLLSVDAIAVSACYSLASVYLTHLVAGHFIRHNDYEALKWTSALFIAFAMGTLYPILARSASLRPLGKIGVAGVLIMSIGALFYVPVNLNLSFGMLLFHLRIMVVSICVSVLMDFGFITVTRGIIRNAGTMRQTTNIVAAVSSTFVLALALISPLALRRVWTHTRPYSELLRAGHIVAVSNTFDILLACLFGFLVVLLLVHRALWPILVRTVFRLQEVGTKTRRLILSLIGVALLAQSVAGGHFPELIQELTKVITRAA